MAVQNGLEEPSLNFSIEDTFEGMGNQDLLKQLEGEGGDNGDEGYVPIAQTAQPPGPPSQQAPTTTPTTTLDLSISEEQKSADFLDKFLNNGEDDNLEEVNENLTKLDKSTDDDNPSGNEEDSQFKALANDLFSLGVFIKEEGEEDVEIDTPEAFLERFNQEKKKGASEIIDNFLGQFGEEYRAAFEAIYVNGVSPKEYFSAYNTIVDFSQLDMTKEENQKSVIRRSLKDQGYEDEDITLEVERLVEYGDLANVSQRHHKILVKKEAQGLQRMQEEASQKLRQTEALKNQYVQNVNTVLQQKLKEKEFDGIPLNPKIVSELQDFLITDRYKHANGDILTEFDKRLLDLKKPENHAMKVKVGLLLKLLEQDPTLSTIQKTGITKKTDTLFQEVVKHTGSKVTTPKSTAPNRWFKL